MVGCGSTSPCREADLRSEPDRWHRPDGHNAAWASLRENAALEAHGPRHAAGGQGEWTSVFVRKGGIVPKREVGISLIRSAVSRQAIADSRLLIADSYFS